MKRLLFSVLGILGLVGMAWGVVDLNKDFMARFVVSMRRVFETLLDSKIKQGKEVEFAYEYFNTFDRMDPVMREWMGGLCERMQKYIADNNMSIVITADVPGCKIRDLDFMDVRCNTTDHCLIIANIFASTSIADEQDKRAQALIDSKNDHQRIKEVFAGQQIGNSCLFDKNALVDRSVEVGEAKIECTPDTDVCVVNQMVDGQLYSACCLIWYDRNKVDVDVTRVYDDVSVDILVRGASVLVSPRKHYFPAGRELTTADFDENCNEIAR